MMKKILHIYIYKFHLLCMPYLRIQIGKAPVKKLQRHLNSLMPRYLLDRLSIIVGFDDCE